MEMEKLSELIIWSSSSTPDLSPTWSSLIKVDFKSLQFESKPLNSNNVLNQALKCQILDLGLFINYVTQIGDRAQRAVREGRHYLNKKEINVILIFGIFILLIRMFNKKKLKI
jgi:hypothetical protein